MQFKLLTILLGCVFLLKTQPLFSGPNRPKFPDNYVEFNFNWDNTDDQPWLGYNFWCNSFLDWRVDNHKAMAYPFFKKRRTAHITSHSIKNAQGNLSVSATIKLYEKVQKSEKGIYGFLIGAGDSIYDGHTNNFVFNTLSPGNCHLFGIKPDGKLCLINYHTDSLLFETQLTDNQIKNLYKDGVHLGIEYQTDSITQFKIGNQSIKLPVNYNIPLGNIALFYDSQTPFTANATFDDLLVTANKTVFTRQESSTVDGILSSFYTNTQDSLFLTVQLMPFTPKDPSKINVVFEKGEHNEKHVGKFVTKFITVLNFLADIKK